MCEIKDSDLNKIRFYHMEGCDYCTLANDALQAEIDSNEIIKLPSYCARGVQGFPHFVNPMNGETVTGWPGTKDELLTNKLKYKPKPTVEGFLTDLNMKQMLKEMKEQNKKEKNKENYVMESMPTYPVVQSMQAIPPEIHYYHHIGGGYSKLSDCWTKRPDFTA